MKSIQFSDFRRRRHQHHSFASDTRDCSAVCCEIADCLRSISSLAIRCRRNADFPSTDAVPFYCFAKTVVNLCFRLKSGWNVLQILRAADNTRERKAIWFGQTFNSADLLKRFVRQDCHDCTCCKTPIQRTWISMHQFVQVYDVASRYSLTSSRSKNASMTNRVMAANHNTFSRYILAASNKVARGYIF